MSTTTEAPQPTETANQHDQHHQENVMTPPPASAELVRAPRRAVSLADQMAYAQNVAPSDFLPRAYRGKPANVLIAIGLGSAMGLTEAEALVRIHVIEGKPSAGAELIAQNVRLAGHKLRTRSGQDDGGAWAECTIVRYDDPDYPYVIRRDMAWATRMKLAGKDNYLKQPETMLQWRAISACARLACSEALYGVVYTPDELEESASVRVEQVPGANGQNGAPVGAADGVAADQGPGQASGPGADSTAQNGAQGSNGSGRERWTPDTLLYALIQLDPADDGAIDKLRAWFKEVQWDGIRDQVVEGKPIGTHILDAQRVLKAGSFYVYGDPAADADGVIDAEVVEDGVGLADAGRGLGESTGEPAVAPAEGDGWLDTDLNWQPGSCPEDQVKVQEARRTLATAARQTRDIEAAKAAAAEQQGE